MSPGAFVHYKTDIKDIDDQHLDILNKANEIVRNRNLTIEELSDKIEQLDQSFIYHLEYEEEMMRQINYKYLLSHIESHKRLKYEFDKIINSLKSKSGNKYFLIEKISKILLDHVDHDDRQYIEYYAEYLKTATIG